MFLFGTQIVFLGSDVKNRCENCGCLVSHCLGGRFLGPMRDSPHEVNTWDSLSRVIHGFYICHIFWGQNMKACTWCFSKHERKKDRHLDDWWTQIVFLGLTGPIWSFPRTVFSPLSRPPHPSWCQWGRHQARLPPPGLVQAWSGFVLSSVCVRRRGWEKDVRYLCLQ